VAWVACPLAAALFPAFPRAQSSPACTVGGVIVSGRTPLPGVVVSIAGADAHAVDATASGTDGIYVLKAPGPGRYTLKAEFAAFAPISRDLVLDAASCSQRADLTMTLASRAPQTAAAPAPAPGVPDASTTPTAPAVSATPTARAGGGRGAAGRGAGGRGQAAGRGQQFQSLELLADDAGLARSDDGAGDASDAASQVQLPPGFSPDTSAESVTAFGTSQASQGFFGPNGPGDFADRFGGGFGGDGAGAGGGPGGQGGFAGGGGPGGGRGFGGPGGPGGGFGRGGRGNQIRGSFYQSFDTSALDASPFALNGQATTKPDYLQQRFGATIGGPLVIPKVINSPRTFFFVNYTGNHSSNPYDAYSTVPTPAERAGDLSALARTLVDPATGQPFLNNQIPAARIDPAAASLLKLIPLPNQSGSIQNFHDVTTVSNQLDDINMRFVHTFGAVPPGRRGQGGGRGGFGGGRGGGRGGQPGVSNLNVTIHYRHSDNTNANPFPTLGGTSTASAWDVPVNYSFTKAGMLHSMRFDLNRQQSQTQNRYAFGQNIAGEAGLLGVSPDPFDWGAPNLSFSTIQGVRDTSPSSLTNRTISVGDTVVKLKGKHTTRFGGDFRSIHADSRTDANARGSYVFTGLYTGLDFSDFLLGLPQQASKQFGPGPEQFRSTSWDLFLQDDWRLSDKVTLNAGLRYEYYSPVSEASNRLETLDVTPGFTAAVPVQAGGTGPFSGALADTIVNPFRAGFAPRVGVAWRVKTGTVVRAGYGINYNASVYQTIAQQLAGQPPFAVTGTVTTASAASPLFLQTALQSAAPGVVTNTYAVDPNYRLPFVQMWNLDLQRDLSRTVQFGIGYTGTKGTNLDLLRAPNRTPTGLAIAGVQPFIWESSQADSFMNSMTVRLRKRLTNGLAVGGTYTLSKSIDDASSIAGNGGTVAQNDRDLAAERALSNFDQRHRFSTDFTYELPFGASKRWFTDGLSAALFGNWIFNGTLQLASGTPLTPRVIGNVSDVARGVNGTLRANYNGQPITISDPAVAEFFNIAAFSPPAPGTFGNAGRNIIIGPGTSTMNLGLTRNITFTQANRGLSIQILASNLLNDVQFASVDTNVSSPTFGQVTGVRPMRRIQVLTRFRF
jgi:hypothetical protein